MTNFLDITATAIYFVTALVFGVILFKFFRFKNGIGLKFIKLTSLSLLAYNIVLLLIRLGLIFEVITAHIGRQITFIPQTFLLIIGVYLLIAVNKK